VRRLDIKQFRYNLFIPKAQQVSSARDRTGESTCMTTVSALPFGKIKKAIPVRQSEALNMRSMEYI